MEVCAKSMEMHGYLKRWMIATLVGRRGVEVRAVEPTGSASRTRTRPVRMRPVRTLLSPSRTHRRTPST
ncbi:hypothetical protein IG631_09920 [Alternaria alternata]|nr:hypothetical protein IG631_09920 [Alternaria alternata]